MNPSVAREFLAALNTACGEIDEAAMLSVAIFADPEELRVVRRELARLMTQIDSRILPVLKKHYPDLAGYVT